MKEQQHKISDTLQNKQEKLNLKQELIQYNAKELNIKLQKERSKQIGWNYKKVSLCRLYLRGNCQNSIKQCPFAHGIKDLVFKKYDEDSQMQMKSIYYDFRNTHPINQLDAQISERDKNYINLYEFQAQFSKIMSQNKKKINQSNQNQTEKTMKEQQTKSQQQKLNKKKRRQYQHYKKKNKIETDKTEKIQIYHSCRHYTLQQINSNRNLKIQIRKRFHQNQFKLFLQLIEKQYHPIQNYQINGTQRQYIFAHDILQLEYFRVGFNKLMTRIKFQFLIDYLVLQYKGGHFKFTSIMPPIRNKPITYYIKLAPQRQIFCFYKQTYQNIKKQFDEKKKNIRQQDVKLGMIKYLRDWWKIPPIVELLRIKHCTFKDLFIRYIMEHQGQQKIHLDWVTDQSILLSQIHRVIQDCIQNKQYCIVSSDILSKNNKFTRSLVEKCVQNQRKQLQVLYKKQKKQKNVQNSQKLILIKFPNIKKQIVTKQCYLTPESKFQHQFGINLDVIIEDILSLILDKINNNNQTPTIRQIQQKITLNHQKLNQMSPDSLQEYKIVEICTACQFQQALEEMLNSSTLLGIDLQGDLSNEQGLLSLIQINHYSKKILYLIDYLTISNKESQENIGKCKKLLIKILNHNDIVKIIHDSRNDAECLYNLLYAPKIKKQPNNQNKQQYYFIKFTNIFDTAASEQVIRQVQDNTHYKPNTPGLNQVLEKYGQTPNKYKQKYHSIWAEGKSDPSIMRPMSQSFKQYCLMDVLGLPKVYGAMSNKINPYFLVFISQMHAEWSHKKQQKNENTEIRKQKYK